VIPPINAVAMYRAGKPPVAIAKALGVTTVTVYYHLRNAGVDLTADLQARQRAAKARFVAIWNAADTSEEAATALGLSPKQAVHRACLLRAYDGIRLKAMPKRPHPPLPSPLGDRVAAFLRRGLSNREVVRRSGASMNYVGRIRKQLGLVTKPRRTADDDALFARFSVAQIMKRTGRTFNAVSMRLRLLRQQGRV
jgi:hypothetical protein